MIYRDIIKGNCEIIISNHARRQAKERGIYYFDIISTIMTGKMKCFGKNYVKFIKDYRRGKLTCVGERKTRNLIRILTIEWG